MADRAGKFDMHSWGERFVAFESASGCDHCPEKGRCFVCAVEIAKKAYEAGVEASAAIADAAHVNAQRLAADRERSAYSREVWAERNSEAMAVRNEIRALLEKGRGK